MSLYKFTYIPLLKKSEFIQRVLKPSKAYEKKKKKKKKENKNHTVI